MKNLSFDTVVCGGGIAGIAAALASARGGAKTCLLEKEYALGGLATLGLVVVYLPLDDGDGVKMSGGICEELLKLSAKYGPVKRLLPEWTGDASVEERAGKRYQCEYSPAGMILAAEELLLREGVTIFYDARVTDVTMRGTEIESVVLATKEGPRPVFGKAFIDCTGDADIAWLAGEQTLTDPTNVCTGWHYTCDGKSLSLHIVSDSIRGELPEGHRYYNGVNLEDITQQVIDGRRMILDAVKKEQEKDPEAYPAIVPPFHGFRMTRRMVSSLEFSEDDHERVWFDDAIGMIGNWKYLHKRYSIPYRAIKSAAVPNLFCAGRCCAAEKSGWDLTRVIPTCAVTGEAAGTACAMLCESGSLPEIRALQDRLKKNGVILDPSLCTRTAD